MMTPPQVTDCAEALATVVRSALLKTDAERYAIANTPGNLENAIARIIDEHNEGGDLTGAAKALRAVAALRELEEKLYDDGPSYFTYFDADAVKAALQ